MQLTLVYAACFSCIFLCYALLCVYACTHAYLLSMFRHLSKHRLVGELMEPPRVWCVVWEQHEQQFNYTHKLMRTCAKYTHTHTQSLQGVHTPLLNLQIQTCSTFWLVFHRGCVNYTGLFLTFSVTSVLTVIFLNPLLQFVIIFYLHAVQAVYTHSNNDGPIKVVIDNCKCKTRSKQFCWATNSVIMMWNGMTDNSKVFIWSAC